MTFDPRTAMIDKDRPSWLRDPKAAARAEFSKEPRGPVRDTRLAHMTKRFDWSELWEKTVGEWIKRLRG